MLGFMPLNFIHLQVGLTLSEGSSFHWKLGQWGTSRRRFNSA